jgi:GTP pyrophosphokinase
VKRSINRVSALLETVDLEFERVLSERQSYSEAIDAAPAEGPLNVDLMASILAELLPPENRSGFEDYSELLADFEKFEVRTADDLRALINRNLKSALAAEKKRVKEEKASGKPLSPEILNKGVFFSHAGLARMAMEAQFGEPFNDYLREKADKEAKGEK